MASTRGTREDYTAHSAKRETVAVITASQTAVGSTPEQAQQAGVTAAELREARGWIADVWGARLARSLTAAEVVAGVRRHYEGGWAQFIADGQAS